MRVALDTNAYVAFCRADEKAVAVVRGASAVVVPLIVVAELRADFLCGTKSAHNERRLQEFLASERVTVPEPDLDTTQVYARLFKLLREKGAPIPTNDLWIASLVLQHGLVLASYDAHFGHIPQLPMAW